MAFLTKNFHFIHLPPLLTIVLFFIIGIACHGALTLFFITFLLLFFLFCISLYLRITIKYYKNLIIFSFFTLAGAWLHHREWQTYHDFYRLVDGKKITVTGTVIDISDTVINNKKSVALILSIDMSGWLNDLCYNKLFVFHNKNSKNIMVGDTLVVHNVSCKKPLHEDFQRYQIKEQIIATIFGDTITYHIENHPQWSLRYWLWNQKKRLLGSLKSKLSAESFRFFSSLFLGNRSCIKKELEDTNEQFKTWGISHFLARSGLHLVLFIFIWQALLRLVPLPLVIKQIILLFFSCLYFTLTWTSAPFTRSFALFMLNKLCLFSKIPFHLLHYLTLVCFLFLLYCPLYLFFLDFQLSFALTFALAWFNQIASEHKKMHNA